MGGFRYVKVGVIMYSMDKVLSLCVNILNTHLEI